MPSTRGPLSLAGNSNTLGSLAGAGTVSGNGSGSGTVLTVGADNTSTAFSGTVQDSGSPLGLTKVGTGALILSGTNTYTGGTTISGGVLSVGNDANLGDPSGGLTLNGGELVIADRNVNNNNFATARTLTLGPGTNVVAGADNLHGYEGDFYGLVTGVGGLTVGDPNSSHLVVALFNSANNYQGGTTLTNGNLLVVFADTALGNASGGITLAGGGLLAVIDGFSSARPVTLVPSLNGNYLLAENQSTVTYTGLISGSGGLNVGDFGGTVVLANAGNSYAGGTTAQHGTLSVGSDPALGDSSGSITLDAGELRTTTDGFTTARPVFLQFEPGFANTLAAGTGTAAGYSGVISGTGGLFVGDPVGGYGTVTLQGVNTYTGGTTVRGQAVLTVSSDVNLGDAAGGLTLQGGALLTTADLSTGRTLTLAPAITPDILAAVAGTTATYTGAITGPGGLLVGDGVNAGTVVLTGANGYAGGTGIRSLSTLVAGADAALGTGTATLFGGTLVLPAGVTLGNAVNFGVGGGTFLNAGTLTNNVLYTDDGVGGAEWVTNAGVINGNVLLGTGPNTVQLFTGSTIAGNLDLGPNAGSTLIL
ncbi:MAG TPA: autotransporter-associated beta strand repeat-containing protein, partial [Chthoniobacterales bacterium]